MYHQKEHTQMFLLCIIILLKGQFCWSQYISCIYLTLSQLNRNERSCVYEKKKKDQHSLVDEYVEK